MKKGFFKNKKLGDAADITLKDHLVTDPCDTWDLTTQSLIIRRDFMCYIIARYQKE